jgi:cytochrome c oxidase assembly factor CtaG
MNAVLPISAEVHGHFQGWSPPLPLTCVLVLVALFYLRGWLRLRSAFPNLIPVLRVTAFMSGLFFLWIAVGSPLSALDHESLTIHMINHLLLMTVAAPLILAGAPRLILQGLPASFGRGVRDSVLQRLAAQRLLSLLQHPVFCWAVATATVIAWHLPKVFQLSVRSHWWHHAEYASFALAGFLFWWPVLQPVPGVARWPRWSIPLYLFLATLPCDILSAFLVFCGRVVYPSYLSAPRLFNFSPFQDQQCAGALMWVWVTFAYLLPAVVITVQILSPSNGHSQHLQGASDALVSPALSGSRSGVA